MEEAELQEMFQHTLANPQSKAYKYLMASCFRQSISPAEELTYDMDILRLQRDPLLHTKFLFLMQIVKQAVRSVFHRHGAVELNTPLLIPKSKVYGDIPSVVQLMTHNGNTVSIPYDLRVPFARYVVANSISSIKRYAIEKVFRERKVYGFHPRELYECAFDVVSNSQGTCISLLNCIAFSCSNGIQAC
jgi:translation initiation factor 2-alpha kinase 4